MKFKSIVKRKEDFFYTFTRGGAGMGGVVGLGFVKLDYFRKGSALQWRSGHYPVSDVQTVCEGRGGGRRI